MECLSIYIRSFSFLYYLETSVTSLQSGSVHIQKNWLHFPQNEVCTYHFSDIFVLSAVEAIDNSPHHHSSNADVNNLVLPPSEPLLPSTSAEFDLGPFPDGSHGGEEDGEEEDDRGLRGALDSQHHLDFGPATPRSILSQDTDTLQLVCSPTDLGLDELEELLSWIGRICCIGRWGYTTLRQFRGKCAKFFGPAHSLYFKTKPDP